MNQTRKLFQATCVFVLFILSSCGSSEDITPSNNNNNNNGQQNTGNATGEQVVNFELSMLGGGTFKMSEQLDKVVVLFFFGNSCPSCRAVGPEIEKQLNIGFSSNSDYVIIGLDQWDGTNSSVESFKNLTGISFPLLLNASKVASSFETTYDRLVVVDKKGKIAHKGTRGATNDISAVVSIVSDLLDDM